MKISLTRIIFFSALSLSSLLSFSAHSAQPEKRNPLNLVYIGDAQDIVAAGLYEKYVHYCHMNTVYLNGRNSRSNSMAMIWNHETGQPLKCSEYQPYTFSMKQKAKSNH